MTELLLNVKLNEDFPDGRSLLVLEQIRNYEKDVRRKMETEQKTTQAVRIKVSARLSQWSVRERLLIMLCEEGKTTILPNKT